MSVTTKVAVLGAGSWGTTVAALLSAKVATVLWARDERVASELNERSTNRTYLGETRLPETLRATGCLREALEGASLVVVAVPSRGIRQVLERSVCDGGLPGVDVPVLSLTKGIEHDSLLRPSQVISQCWPGRHVAVLTGPNLAGEVLAGQPSASVVASDDRSLGLELQAMLASETMRVYTNGDVTGCEVAGIVKNVMAVATGMAVGLGFGDNTRAALITRALAELTRLGISLGGEVETFSGLAGIGDLVATCTSPKSRNFSVGVALGKGRSLAEILAGTRMVAEGVASCQPVVSLARSRGVEVPVAEQVAAVCHGGSSPIDTIPRLMGRAPRPERDGDGEDASRPW